MVEVSLTVGKLDASLALLLTKDHHLIEFPTILLPDGVNAGSVVTIKCEQDSEQESKEKQYFEQIQDQIFEKFGKNEPKPPILKIKNVTQTSAVLEWDQLDLGSANIKSLTLYKNNSRLGQIPNPLVNTTTKLSGLPIDTPYEFYLRLDTTAGIYQSEPVKLRTHKMTDLSGITVCLGEIDPKEGITREDIEQSLANMGAKPLQDEVKVDTTHFICTLSLGPQWNKALENNIPIVRPEWLKASETERRIIGVRNFYLDADPSILEQHRFKKPAPKEESKDETPKEESKEESKESAVGSTTEAAKEQGTKEQSAPDQAESTESTDKKDDMEDVPIDSNEPKSKDQGDDEQVTKPEPIKESAGPVTTEPSAEEKIETSSPEVLESQQKDPSENIEEPSEPVESITATETPVAEASESKEAKEPEETSKEEESVIVPTETNEAYVVEETPKEAQPVTDESTPNTEETTQVEETKPEAPSAEENGEESEQNEENGEPEVEPEAETEEPQQPPTADSNTNNTNKNKKNKNKKKKGKK